MGMLKKKFSSPRHDSASQIILSRRNHNLKSIGNAEMPDKKYYDILFVSPLEEEWHALTRDIQSRSRIMHPQPEFIGEVAVGAFNFEVVGSF